MSIPNIVIRFSSWKTGEKIEKLLKGYKSKINVILNTGSNFDAECLVLNKNIEIQQDKFLMNKTLDKLKIPHPKTIYNNFIFKDKNKVLKFYRSEEFVQELMPFEHKYRVVVDWYGVIDIKEKIGTEIIKKYSNTVWKKIKNDKLEAFALCVCSKMCVDFTGLDIGEIDDKFYVIELNSAPGLSDKTTKKLVNHLKKLGG